MPVKSWHILEAEECWALLEARHLGRLAFVDQDGPGLGQPPCTARGKGEPTDIHPRDTVSGEGCAPARAVPIARPISSSLPGTHNGSTP